MTTYEQVRRVLSRMRGGPIRAQLGAVCLDLAVVVDRSASPAARGELRRTLAHVADCRGDGVDAVRLAHHRRRAGHLTEGR